MVLLIDVGLRLTGEGGTAVFGVDLSSRSLGATFAAAVSAATFVLVIDLFAAREAAGIIRTVQHRLRSRTFDAYSDADWITQSSDPAGHLQELMSTNVTRALNLTTTINTGLVALATLCMFIGSAFLLSPLSTSIMIAVLGLLLLSLTPLTERIRSAAEDVRGANLAYALGLAQIASVPTEVQTLGVVDAAREAHGRSVDDLATDHAHLTFLERAIPSAQRNLSLLAVLGVVAGLHVAGIAEPTALAAVVVLLSRSLTYAHSVQQTINKFAAAGPFVLALDDEIHRYGSAQSFSTGTAMDIRTVDEPASIDISELDYTHPNAASATLSDISIRVEAGEFLAIAGHSGSGKTTLVEILLGLRPADSGNVRIAGVEVAALSREARTETIGFVPQHPAIIMGTVAENVRFLRSDISDEKVRSALADANLLDEVNEMPEGINTQVGSTQRRLSGGQSQRLAIARALAGSPRVLILDEPTSSLDPHSEAAISESLISLAGAVTIVVIAHRETTVSGSDKVLLLSGGRTRYAGSARSSEVSRFWGQHHSDSATNIPNDDKIVLA